MNLVSFIFAQPPPWLVRCSPLAVGEGMEPSYRHSWSLPPSLTVLFLIVALIVVAFLYWRERGSSGTVCRSTLIVLRMSLVSLVVLMLYGWMQQQHVTDLADIIVLIDDSASMSLRDQGDDEWQQQLQDQLQQLGFDESDRLSVAKAILLKDKAQLLNDLERRYHLKIFRMGRSLRTVDGLAGTLAESVRSIQAGEDSSRLGDAVRDVLDLQRGRPTAAMIVLTDGITTAGPSIGEVSKYSRRKGIPMHIVGIGNARSLRDVRISDLLVERVVFVDDLLHFDFKLSASRFDQKVIVVRLQQQGSKQVLAEQQVKIEGDDQSQTVRLSYRPQEVGEFEFVVEASAPMADIDLSNNRKSQEVRVTDESIRVLLVQEYPNYEFRALKNLLSRGLKRGGAVTDRAVELTTILQEADLPYVELDTTAESTFPVNREELYPYDVVIFGDVNRKLLSESALQNLSDYVTERGGGLVLIAGPRHLPRAYQDTPLEKLFPAEIASMEVPPADQVLVESFPVKLGRMGLLSSHMQLAESTSENVRAWQQLPGLRWLLATSSLHSGARVLLEHPTEKGDDGKPLPVITLQFVGAGKVVFHATDETWRWRGGRSGDQSFDHYWLQTIRYLSRSKLLGKSREAELTASREEYRQGDAVQLRVRFFDDRLAPPLDDGVSVVVDREQGNRKKMVLHRETGERGIFVGTVSQLAEGKYRAWLATPTLEGEPPATAFRILPPDQEMTRKKMDSSDLRLAAKISRGGFYSVSQMDQLLAALPAGRQVRIQSQPPEPLWNSWVLALAFLMLVTGEWCLRKRVGMM
jgi:hypothetical protein